MKTCIETKIDGYDAVMLESEDGFTMYLLEKGGPIITRSTKEECLKNFKEAMGLMIAVMKLTEFSRSGTFNYKNK